MPDVTPDKAQVFQQLETIERSTELAGSERLSSLLRYLVTEALEGRGETIKGYTIGIDVFGRDEGFDPQSDTIVRVHAARLRKALELYYLGPGSDDEIVITIPRGGYCPFFNWRSAPAHAETGAATEPATETAIEDATPAPGPLPPSPPPPRTAPRRRIRALAAAVVVLFAAAMLAWYLQPPRQSEKKPRHEVSSRGLPRVAVFPLLDDRGPSGGTRAIATALTLELTGALRRFRNLDVMNAETMRRLSDRHLEPSAAIEALELDFLVHGFVLRDADSLRVDVELSDPRGRPLWAQRYDRALPQALSLETQTTLAREIASHVGQPHGVIQQHMRTDTGSQNGGELVSHYCLMAFFKYTADKSEEAHGQVRNCLEKALESDPGFADGWSALSWIYGDEHRYGFNPRGDALDRALTAAQTGYGIEPFNAFTVQYLASTRMLRREYAAAQDNCLRAVSLNAGDTDLLADCGAILFYTGQRGLGVALVNQALALNHARPRWYRVPLFFDAYWNQDMRRALAEARVLFNPELQFSYVYLALAHFRLGNDNEAREAVRELARLDPGFAADPAAALTDLAATPELLQTVIADLHDAGLTGPAVE